MKTRGEFDTDLTGVKLIVTPRIDEFAEEIRLVFDSNPEYIEGQNVIKCLFQDQDIGLLYLLDKPSIYFRDLDIISSRIKKSIIDNKLFIITNSIDHSYGYGIVDYWGSIMNTKIDVGLCIIPESSWNRGVWKNIINYQN